MTFNKYLKTQCVVQSRETRYELQRPIDGYFTGKEVTVYCESSRQQQNCITLYGRI